MRSRGRLCVRCGCKQAYCILDVCFLGYRWWWGRALTIVFVLVCLYIAHAFLGPVIACIEDSYDNVFYIVCAGLVQATVWVDWRVCNERVHVGAFVLSSVRARACVCVGGLCACMCICG